MNEVNGYTNMCLSHMAYNYTLYLSSQHCLWCICISKASWDIIRSYNEPLLVSNKYKKTCVLFIFAMRAPSCLLPALIYTKVVSK